ncbi:hypothetical protein BDV24DRAFT_151749 [Aspergillus arachidicola]|uniref:Uncharacterized protein n=1 Tax=Aspergillus arachidicola TaxID=656916 RepID=A0A5N6Y863_9EURO|nr:hypothetical protein BDV24DRAFT_151749 [Aspergillus arachidicola]
MICSDTESTYSNECASNRGYGTDDTLAVTRDWEICVPTELMGQAVELLLSEPYATQYRLLKPWPYYNPYSLIHTYHRFKSRGINHYSCLVPSVDVHIDWDPSNCLNTCNMLQLCDVIDGTNVSEEWGENNLDIEGTNDEFGGKNKREVWQSLVRTKEDRLDWTKPKDVFITQHRATGAPDPWTELSDMS